jgi:hypothetical protein
MQNSKIYLKDSELARIPPSQNNSLNPILFAETGVMPSSKGKKKKCILMVNINGIYFFRPDTKGTIWKVGQFISIYDLNQIVQVDAKRRDLIATTASLYFSCDHADECVSWIFTVRQSLFLCAGDIGPIVLTNYRSEIKTYGVLISDANASQARYATLCHRYGSVPCEAFLRLFETFDIAYMKTLVLDQSYHAPPNLKAITAPILQLGAIRELHFVGFAPYAVCRIAHACMKHTATIRTIVFEGYSFLIPAQLRMDKLKIADPVSFTFLDCHLSESVFASLVDQLTKFMGPFQRLSIKAMQFTAQMLKQLFKAFKRKCFRGLEMLELEGIDAKQIAGDRILRHIVSALRSCRFLSKLTISSWVPRLALQFSAFSRCYILNELVLSNIDMAQPIIAFTVPPNLHFIDVSRSHFTIASLQSFLKILARVTSPLSLNLADLVLPEAHWKSFFDALPALPTMNSVRELDWSGNPMPSDVFLRYFFETNAILFLVIDRIFKPTTSPSLESFLRSIPHSDRLVGLSVGGDQDCNYSGALAHLTQALQALPNLQLLHVNGQKIQDADCPTFLEFISGRSKIVEVSCDDSLMSGQSRLITFYKGLSKPAFAHPVLDISRLGSCSVPFARFPASTPRTRAFYFSSLTFSRGFSAGEFFEYSARADTNLALFQTRAKVPEQLLSSAVESPQYISPEVDVPPKFHVPVRDRSGSYKVIFDGLNPAFMGQWTTEVKAGAQGVKYRHLEFVAGATAINIWTWAEPQEDDPKFYTAAAGVLRLFSGDADMDAFLERIRPFPLPSAALIGLVVVPGDVAAASKFARQDRVELLEVKAVSWGELTNVCHSFVKRLHEREDSVKYAIDDEFAPAPAAPAPEEPEICLITGGMSFRVALSRLPNRPDLAHERECEVKSQVGPETMLEFVNALMDARPEVSDGSVQGLSALAEEFGCEELRKECAQFLAKGRKEEPPEEGMIYFKMLQECEDEMEQIDTKVVSLQAQFTAMTAELNVLPGLLDSM